MATKQIDISKYSAGEFSYILNSYIEESFTDVKIQYIMMERNNIVDSPFSLFNEADNNAAKNGILEKIKTIVRNVLNAIASIFEKIGDAVNNILDRISSLRVRQLNDRYKKFINEIDDSTFSKIVENNVTEWRDINALYEYNKSHQISIPTSRQEFKDAKDNIKNMIDNKHNAVQSCIHTDKQKIAKAVTKDIMLLIMFSGSRKAFINLRNIKKGYDNEIKDKERKLYQLIGRDNIDTTEVEDAIDVLKSISKMLLFDMKTIRSFVIFDSKQLVKVAHALEHEFDSRNKLKT